MPPTDAILKRWWPTTQSLDLVEGPVQQVAEALLCEFERYAKDNGFISVWRRLKMSWRRFENLDSAFASASYFAHVPTYILALPTRSKWTALWHNSFLCDGYDSLCWCLTSNHHLTTIHWSAHDDWTTFQSGAHFVHRTHDGTKIIERSVSCAQEDSRWHFDQSGPPLAEEDLEAYKARRKRDRLNERHVLALLDRLGARPWSEDFYALPEMQAFSISRAFRWAVVTRPRDQLIRAGKPD